MQNLLANFYNYNSDFHFSQIKSKLNPKITKNCHNLNKFV